MNPAIARAKKTQMVVPASFTNAATAAGYVDCIGYDFLTVDVSMSTADAVSNKPSVLRLLETDATQPTASSNYATFAGYVSGTDYTIPNAISAATSITQPFATFNVPLQGRKRYIRVEVSPVTTQIVSALAQLTRAEQSPSTSSQATLVVNPT